MVFEVEGATLGEYGVGQKSAEILYSAVFLPKIEYASEIWVRGVRTGKAVKAAEAPSLDLESLQTVAGRLPLDLEIDIGVLKKCRKRKEITEEEMREGREEVRNEWQRR